MFAQVLCAPFRLTHVATVIAWGSRMGLRGTRTVPDEPSKESAWPIWPAVHVAPPESAPVFPFPEESNAEGALPSSHFQKPRSPEGNAGLAISCAERARL